MDCTLFLWASFHARDLVVLRLDGGLEHVGRDVLCERHDGGTGRMVRHGGLHAVHGLECLPDSRRTQPAKGHTKLIKA